MSEATAQTPIGLIAGNGIFPRLFVEAAKKAGHTVVAVAFAGETQPASIARADASCWLRLGKLGQMLRFFRAHNVIEAAMAGGLNKRRLLGNARPDFLAWRLLMQSTVRNLQSRGDDSLLRALSQALEARGLKIIASTTFMSEALAPRGVLTQRAPTPKELRDLHYGLKVARALGAMDVGQTVVVRQGAVTAVEAIEGTDACLSRGGGQGACAVKVAKPQQDMRFDVPALGTKTIESLVLANIKTMGIEADRTLLLEPEKVIALANCHGIALVAL